MSASDSVNEKRSPLVAGLKVAALILTALLVGLAAGEVVVRSVCGDKFGARPAFFMGDDRLGWKPSPALDHTFYGYDFNIHVRTDAEGYRLGALGEVDYGKKLVVLAGDSYSFGWGVSTDETFASYLDVILDRQSGGRTRLVNLGVGGYGMVQTCDRLDEFFRAHPDVDATVLVQHAINDPIDNLDAIGYHLGIWKTVPVTKPRSRFHLVNLMRYAGEAWTLRVSQRSTIRQRKNVPFVEDLLWSYERKVGSVEYPSEIDMGGESIKVDSYFMELDRDSLLRRRQLSRVQSDLMAEALDCIHTVCASHHATVVHIFIATTPGWYAQEVGEIARRSARETQCVATIAGRIPRPGEFGGSITNAHTGGHFTPQFNRFWAERVADFLERPGRGNR